MGPTLEIIALGAFDLRPPYLGCRVVTLAGTSVSALAASAIPATSASLDGQEVLVIQRFEQATVGTSAHLAEVNPQLSLWVNPARPE